MRLCYHAALCPILHAPFREPVVAEDGHTYEKSAITAWLQHTRGRGAAPLSPLTGAPLRSKTLRPNHALRSLLAEASQGAPTVALDDEPSITAEPAFGAMTLTLFTLAAGAAASPLLSFATSPAGVLVLSRLLMLSGIAFVLAGLYLTLVPPPRPAKGA